MTPSLSARGYWDPPAQAREWYRHVKEGKHGWKVYRDHRPHIKLDNKQLDVCIIYREQDWIADTEHRPLTKFAIAKVAFEADKALCIAMGLVDKSKREWLNLRDENRQAWIEKGPRGSTPEDRTRQSLFQAVMKELEPLAL